MGMQNVSEQQLQAFADQYQGWEAWQSIKGGQLHARKKGSLPPMMVHDMDLDGLGEQVSALERIPYKLP
jgi:hypothetical protein